MFRFFLLALQRNLETTMDGILEFKNYGGESIIEDVDMKSRRVTGYLSGFGNKDHGGDIIPKGAFAKTLKERGSKIFFLNQHNWAQPHGRFDELSEDNTGLKFVSNPMIDTSYSTDALKLYEAGIVIEHSIGYQIEKAEYSKEDKANILQELKLYEGSNVTMGMNPETPFTGFKCRTMKEADNMIKKLLKAFRNGTFTDETFHLIEVALKQLQLEAFELGKKEQKSLVEPTEEVTSSVEPTIELIKEFNRSLESDLKSY